MGKKVNWDNKEESYMVSYTFNIFREDLCHLVIKVPQRTKTAEWQFRIWWQLPHVAVGHDTVLVWVGICIQYKINIRSKSVSLWKDDASLIFILITYCIKFDLKLIMANYISFILCVPNIARGACYIPPVVYLYYLWQS